MFRREEDRLEQISLPRSDVRLFEGIDSTQGTCPVLAMVGAPVVVRRLEAPPVCRQRDDFTNTWATMFNIKPDDGFAPMSWQAWVGPAVVYRADGGDLTEGDVYVLWDLVMRLADMYSEGLGRSCLNGTSLQRC
jgi:hypothetical protein